MTPVILSEEALADAAEIADWYIQEDALHAVQWFRDELNKALARLALSRRSSEPQDGPAHAVCRCIAFLCL